MLPRRPRILMITRNLPPMTGGIERLNYHVCETLADAFELHVCGPVGGDIFVQSAQSYSASPPAPLGRFLIHNAFKAARSARRFKPDLVYAASGLVGPAAALAAKICGAKMCAYLHGLDIVTAHPVYRTMFLPAIRTSDRFLVNSENTKNLAANANIDIGSIHVLHPGVSIPDDESQEAETQLFRRLIDAQDRPILLSVGRLTTRKGIAEFIEQGLPEIARQVPDVLYVIIGEEPRQATSNRGRGLAERIRKTARTHGLEKHVRLLGRVEDDVLEQAYFGCQAHVFPVLEQAGDVEGFGMVAIEAAAHGLPTIAFAVGGIPDAVSEGRSGYLVASGDYPAMTARIVSTLKRNGGTPSASDCREFALQFSWQSFRERLLRQLFAMLD